MKRATPLSALLAITFIASVGTGVIWNGVPFIAKNAYGFTESTTLWLYVALGAVYVAAAWASGAVLRRLDGVMSPRTFLGVLLVVQSAVCVGPVFDEAAWLLWLAAGVNSMTSAMFWPVIESYLTSSRHGGAMRSAIGWWNLSWTSAVTASMLMMAPLNESAYGEMAIVWLGPVNVLGLVCLAWFPRAPAPHHEEGAVRTSPREYPMLMRAARTLLPVSYFMYAAMSPLLPFLLAHTALPRVWETPVSAVWMASRVLIIFLLWKWGGWHGRWGTLLLAGAALVAGFGVVVSGQTVLTIAVGLGVFGCGMGITYYAALYYGMTVGEAKVDAGGAHEALIGAGYSLGPAASLLAIGIASSIGRGMTNGTEQAGLEATAVIVIVWLVVAVAGVSAARRYVEARKARRGGP